MAMLLDMATLNHDIPCRSRWTNSNEMAIWDNRSMSHTPTADFSGLVYGDRLGFRAMSGGERPYFDTQGSARSTAWFREEDEAGAAATSSS